MQRNKLIAAALAVAFTTPAWAESANVTVYGVANVSIDAINIGSGTTTANGNVPVNGFGSNKVSSNTSRLGLKGSEDLGDGLAAIWQIESLVSLDNAGGSLGTRNTFAGLKSDSAGTVLLGRHDTPYNISTRRFDVFTDTIADNRSILGGGRAVAANAAPRAAAATVGASFDSRQPDVAAYISPSLNGFAGAVAYVAGAEGQTLATQTKGGAWSAAGWYAGDSLYASLAYEIHTLGNAGGTLGNNVVPANTTLSENAWKAGLSYKLEGLTASLSYEKTSDDFGAAKKNLFGHTAYYVSGRYDFGSNAIKLAYSKAGKNSVANTGANQISAGFDHSLSKRTTLYAQYTQLKNDAAGVYTTFSATNATGSPAALTVAQTGFGAKLSAVQFGLKHTF
ncbi:porin [Ferriphaselus sp. R-1]|uniref:porin n=1 Tax=Ferriphaselus sp. R-1 TaxID=1485544 RepID=UPI00055514E3|nr:porin [Ferriphaselus sp. R-1]